MIKNVIFDIGDVLIDFCWRKALLSAGVPESSADALGNGLVIGPLWNQLDLGVMPEEDVVAMAKAKLPQYADYIDRFWAAPEAMVAPLPGSRDWLAGLKQRGYGIYLLSNYPRSLFELHSRTTFDFLDIPDGYVVSSHVKLTKPDPRIYQLLMEKYSLLPEECAYIDDRLPNVEAADRLGLKAIRYVSREQARADLEALLGGER